MNKEIKKIASRYIKHVEWSEEDKCFVGTCPELFGGGCHGRDELAVFQQLTSLVEEAVEDLLKEGKTLPKPLASESYSGKFILRTGPELHKALAIRAFKEGKSLNQVCVEALRNRR